MPISRRQKIELENSRIRLVFLPGGGHIAAVTLLSNGVNPLWDPPWESIEPSQYDPARHPQYGERLEGALLAGIAGHNLCFDFFGAPSEEEHAAGLYVHGEASRADWEASVSGGELRARAELPIAAMGVERTLRVEEDSQIVRVTETAENLSRVDRPVGWTQHVTMGPPFLAKGKTLFHAPATHSKVFEGDFAPGHGRLKPGAEFEWPFAPAASGGLSDLRVTADDASSGAYTAHLLDPLREQAWFTAYHPGLRTLFGYIWKRDDFPWLGIWEENHSRAQPPWNGRTLTRGFEFGVSPFAESRRAMVDRGKLFGERTYRWIPARGKITVEYAIFLAEAAQPAETAAWKGGAIDCGGEFVIR